jgi:hypothetical protein
MKLILKITAGILLAGVLTTVGCAALIGGAADSVTKDQEKNAASVAQVKQLHHGMTRREVHAVMAPAKPNLDSSSATEGLGTSAIENYDVKDGGKLFGKSVMVSYSNGHVIDITSTDLG